jgi:hypothetical protein
MVKLVLSNVKKVTLKRGNRIITRNESDYKININMYNFRGFKLIENTNKEIKETQKETKQENIVKLKPQTGKKI